MKLFKINKQILKAFEQQLLARNQNLLEQYEAQQLIKHIRFNLEQHEELFKIIKERSFQIDQQGNSFKRETVGNVEKVGGDQSKKGKVQENELINEKEKQQVNHKGQNDGMDSEQFEDDLAHFNKNLPRVDKTTTVVPWKKRTFQQPIDPKKNNTSQNNKKIVPVKLKQIPKQQQISQDQVQSIDSQWQQAQKAKDSVKQKVNLHISGQYIQSMTRYNRKKGQTNMRFGYWLVKQQGSCEEYLIGEVDATMKQSTCQKILNNYDK